MNRVIIIDYNELINNNIMYNLVVLKRIADAFNAKVVVIPSSKYTLLCASVLSSMIEHIGIEIHYIKNKINYNRVNEINKYLENNNIDNYIIIDENLVDLSFINNQIFCNIYEEIKEEYIKLIIDIFNNNINRYIPKKVYKNSNF